MHVASRFQLMLCVLVMFLSGCAAVQEKMDADRAFRAGDYSAAASGYERILGGGVGDWKDHIRLGYAYLKTGRPDRAVAEFEKVQAQAYAKPWATYYLGLAYIAKGDRRQAVEVWKTFENRLRRESEVWIGNEIKRQETLLRIADCEAYARRACREEAGLKAAPRNDAVAVISFADESGDHRFGAFNKALAAMVIADLSRIKAIKVVERMQMEALLAEMRLAGQGLVDLATAPRLGRLLGAERIVVGSVQSGSVAITGQVVSASKGQALGAVDLKGPQEQFFELQKELVYRIVALLDLDLTAAEKAAVDRLHTRNYKAFIYYGQALEYFDRREFPEAKAMFEKALAEDPEFWLAAEGAKTAPDPASLKNLERLGMPNRGSNCGN